MTKTETTHNDTIKAMAAGTFETLVSRLPNGGSLQARKSRSGVQLYWRFTHEGKTSREPIGTYDSTAPPKKKDATTKGYGITAALERCAELGKLHSDHANVGGLHEAKAKERRAHLAIKAEKAAKETRTLGKLMTAYVDHLKAQRRVSYADAASIFKLHVETHPELLDMPAADVTPEHVLELQRGLIAKGKRRTANKLRAYLGAAFQCAIAVRTTPTVPVTFKAFEVVFNPAAQTKRDAGGDLADKNPLTTDQLRTYWNLIKSAPGLAGAAMRIQLLAGGQRIEQIIKLKWKDVAADSLMIYDGKGRPGSGIRPHALPIVATLATTIANMNRAGEYVMSSTAGKTPISASTLSGWARAAALDAIPGFQIKRVRSGIETLLASKGVSREIRGHLQSHGLSGVQARHYDGHDYMPEKRRALQILIDDLEGKMTDNVVPIGQAA